MTLEKIPINIWDDFHDDGFIPKGEIQETHAYIEEYDELTEEQKDVILGLVFAHLQTLDMPGVEMDKVGAEIQFKHLTHERLERLLEELETSDLNYNGVPIDFYSES